MSQAIKTYTKRCPICNKYPRIEDHGFCLYMFEKTYCVGVYLSCNDWIKGGLIPLTSNRESNHLILSILSDWNNNGKF